MITSSACLICSKDAPVAFPEYIREMELSSFSFSSRKVPEFFHYEYRLCDDCDLLYSSSRPSEEDLLAAYEGADYDSGPEARLAADTYSKLIFQVKGLLPNQNLLDVGCGDGAFLEIAQDRLNLVGHGVEPSTLPAREAAKVIGERLYVGNWKELDSDQEFGIITLFQTVEHLLDPLGFLDFCRDKLAPGGLVAIAAHDRNALVNRVLGARSPIFDIEHLQIFSKASLALLVQTKGFEPVQHVSYVNRYPASYFLRLAGLNKSSRQKHMRPSAFDRVLLPAPFGNQMLIARKHG